MANDKRGGAYVPACWGSLGTTESPAPWAILLAPAHSRVGFHGKLSLAVVVWGSCTLCLTSPQGMEGLI